MVCEKESYHNLVKARTGLCLQEVLSICASSLRADIFTFWQRLPGTKVDISLRS